MLRLLALKFTKTNFVLYTWVIIELLVSIIFTRCYDIIIVILKIDVRLIITSAVFGIFDEYSSFGLTRVVYAFTFISCEHPFRCLLIRPRVIFAFEMMLSTWVFHLSSFCSSTPR